MNASSHREPDISNRETGSHIKGVRMVAVAILNVIITVTELAGGLLSGSISLLSDSLHNFGDTAAVLLSWVAIRVAGRSRSERKTYGYQRAEILAAFVNAAFLLVLSVFLAVAAVQRFWSPSAIDGSLMMLIAAIGLGANLVSTLLLRRHARASMNVRSSYLHMLSDSVSSFGVFIGGAAVRIWHILWIDPLIAILIAFYIIRQTWMIVKEAVDILMQSSANVDYAALKNDIESIPGVVNIHHVHTWRSDEKTIYLEAHVDLCDMMLSETNGILHAIETVLTNRYSISHATIQFESGRCVDKEMIKI
jgi:cobalt-zinc-cadmium efflux system protein